MEDIAVDLVYLWVDGNDPLWSKEKEKWASKLGIKDNSINSCRFIDNNELKYSIRSCLKNIPWVNNIYIITNGQKPKWLDIGESSKLKIVTHNQIMPEESLPTFNSEAIECCIDKIKDLSEYFILANDDCFFYKETPKSYFFNKNHEPILRMVRHSWSDKLREENLYCGNVYYCAELLKEKKFLNLESSHSFVPCRKSLFTQCKSLFSNEFYQTTKYKFRTKKSIQKTLISYFSLKVGKATLKIISNTGEKANEDLFINLDSIERAKRLIELNSPYTFCLNDCENTPLYSRQKIPYLLSSLFPIKTKFEKNMNLKDFQITPVFEHNAITIVLSPDNKFIKYSAATVSSLVANSSSNNNYDIVIFDSDITEENKCKLQSIVPSNFRLRFFNIDQIIFELFSGITFKTRSYWSVATYYRLLIPIIMQKFDRVLYLDSDICINENIDCFFNQDFSEDIIAVSDTVSPCLDFYKKRKLQMINDLKLKEPSKYFNAGVVLFNNKIIDANKYFDDLKKALSINNLLFQDQDILNVIFQDRVKMVSCKYNVQIGVCIWDKNYFEKIINPYKEDFSSARKKPVIIHFTGYRKPWHDPSIAHGNIFWKYLRETPFYEECLVESQILNNRNVVSKDDLQLLLEKRKILTKYYFYKVLKFLSFGAKKIKIENKLYKYKKLKNRIREFISS